MKRWLGLKDLVEDAVEHGSFAVERVHQHVASTPLRLLAQVPPLAPAARQVISLQHGMISVTYELVRSANRLAGAVVGTTLRIIDVKRRP